jgi:hypothetical protein
MSGAPMSRARASAQRRWLINGPDYYLRYFFSSVGPSSTPPDGTDFFGMVSWGGVLGAGRFGVGGGVG